MKKHKIRSKIISTASIIAIVSMNGIGVAEASWWWNNNIQLNNGGDVYISNNLNKDLNGGSGDDIITISGHANGSIDLGSGNDNIVISGNSSKIKGGSGNDIITISGNSNGYIDGGNNNDTITVAGNTNKIYGGSGNDILTISGHANGSIDLGSGNDNIVISGNSSKIKGGSGKDIILVKGTANQTIEGGSGDDIICISNLNSKIEGDSGYDTVYVKEGLDNWKYNKIDAESINKVSDINTIDACKGGITTPTTPTDNNCVAGSTNGFGFEAFNHGDEIVSEKTITDGDGNEQKFQTTLKCNNGEIITVKASKAVDIICKTGFTPLTDFLGCESNTNDCDEGSKNGFNFPFFNHQANNFAEKIENIINGKKIIKVSSTCNNGDITLGTEETVTYSCDAGFNDDDNNGTCEANDAGNYVELNVNRKGEMLVAEGCNNFLEGKTDITFSTDVEFDSAFNFRDTIPFVNYLHSDGYNDNSFRIELHPRGNNKFSIGINRPGDSENSGDLNTSLLFDGNKHNITVKIQNKSVKYIIDGNIVGTDTFESNTSFPGKGLLVFGQEQDRRGGRFDLKNEYTQGKIYSMKFFSSDDTTSTPIVEWNMDNFSDNKTTSTNGNYTLYKTAINSNSDNISPTAYSTCIDTTPENIVINDYSDLDTDETIITPEITLEGINVPVNVSISDGEVILNGHGKGNSTTAEEYDKIKFKMTADENKTVTINIGGLTKTVTLSKKEEVAKKVTVCHRTEGINEFIPITISVNAMHTHIDHHFDYISEDGTCSCIKEISTTNLVSNGSFETFSLLNRIKSWYNNLFGFISKFNTLTAWNSNQVNFELWKNHPDSNAAHGDTFIELDVERNSQDKISQNIITEAGKKYVLGFDLKGRVGDSDNVIVKYNNEIVATENGGDDWVHYEVVITGVDGTSTISFEEPSSDDNSYGTWLDNISVNEIVKSCPTDESDSSGLTPGADSDGDGIPDTVETGTDTDGDGTPNYLDTDSDGDGILDSIEGTGDDDNDSIMNFMDGDNDTDGDGIADIIDGVEDTDGDGTFNYNDLDSDNDGISDETEGAIDTDGDNIYNFIDTDSDGDNILDSVEGTTDTDGDGIPNYIDTDSDDDGISDEVEGTTDTDGDGIPNYLDNDSDGDGIPDLVEGITDNDNDGIPNYLDTDSDGDGIPDISEIVNDSDNDGIPDYLDSDSDGDGIPDYIEITEDPDEDGIPNYLDLDSDGDGISDEIEKNVDSDNDGIPDYIDTDSDNDGIPDSEEGGSNDSDGDGILDYLDEDTTTDDSEGSDDTTTEETDTTDTESSDDDSTTESTPEQVAESVNFVKENLKECRVDGNKLILQFSHTYNVIK